MTYRTFVKTAASALLLCLGLPLTGQAQLEGLDVPTAEPAVETMPVMPEAQFNEDGYPVLSKRDVDSWLDGFMPYALETGEIAGAVVSVVKDGEILTSRGFGYADLDARKPMDGEDTLVRPGSVSKLFAWTAVMQQVEQGTLDLDTDINQYIDFVIESPFGEPITMRHLMTHTAGFEEVVRNLIIDDPEQLISLEDYLKDYIPPRIFAPGTTPAYSNYATGLAGYVVERLSGLSFEDYIEQNIFEPLGMDSSTFVQPLPAEFEDRMSKGYSSGTDPDAGDYEMIPAGPAGALASTATDMARFMIAHLDNGGALLSAETSAQMMTPQMVITPPLNPMALGFYVQDFNELRSRGHGGDTMYFHSDLYLLLDESVGIFVSMNSSGSMTNVLRAELANNFVARYFADAAIEYEPRLDTAKQHAAEVAGVYESSRASSTTFIALLRYLGQYNVTPDENGDLLLQTLSPKPTRWREVEPYVWRREGGHERFSAAMDDKGNVTHVTFEPISAFTIMKTPPWYRSSALLNPLLYLALAALTLTIILWPVRGIVRRRYAYAPERTQREKRSYLWVRLGVLGVFLALGGWMMVISTLESDLTALTSSFDFKLGLTQFGQILYYIALGLTAWNVFVVWSSEQSWFAKLWSVVLMLSVIIVIWFAKVGGLLHFGTGF